MRIVLYISVLLIHFIANAQVFENRILKPFNKIEVSKGEELIFTESNVPSIKVETDDLEKINRIATEISGGVLKVYVNKLKENRDFNFKILKVTVSQANVSSFSVSTGASIAVTNAITQAKLRLDVSSGAHFEGKLLVSSLEGDFSSGSSSSLSGSCETARITATSAANCDARKLLIQEAKIFASSVSTVSTTVKKSLVAKASSRAIIEYVGKPEEVVIEKSSMGRVVSQFRI